ncbi:MAG TPA: hypothetical protein PK129_02360, partial [Cellvibrionaceae bacterium]|nr:hypothetical protein [Cellvibrionaceae bacterium]
DTAQSPQQALNNYTANQAAPTDNTPVPQPAAPNPPAEEVKPEAMKAAPAGVTKPEQAAKPEPTVKHEIGKEPKVEPPKEAKPVNKPVEVKAVEAIKPEISKSETFKPETSAESAKPSKPVKPADDAVKASEAKLAAKPDEKPKMKQEKMVDAPVGIASSSKKLSKMDENAYVLQIMVTNSAKKVEDILAGAPNKKDLAAYKTLRDGKEVFIVVEGEYPNANAAAAAAKNLPSMQQSAKPWPKKVGLIHAEIKSP